MKNILILSQYFYPSINGGGPVQSISNLINTLSGNYNIFVLTSDRDLNSSVCYENITSGSSTIHKGAHITYFDSRKLNSKNIIDLIKDYSIDIVYINSFFSYKFSILPVLSILASKIKVRIILAPRGEFSPGALKIKRYKKMIFLFISKIFFLYKRIEWHSTSELEVDHIIKQFGKKSKIYLAHNIPKITNYDYSIEIKKERGALNLVFLSRISFKKNLIGALEILRNIVDRNIYFDIYGPIEDKNYWLQCQSIINILPRNITVSYKGVIDNKDTTNIFQNYHAFLFPTFGENYGHVIYESLSSGCPVIISNQTPWQNLEVNNAGWSYPLDEKSMFVNIIRDLAEFDLNSYLKFRKGSLDYINKYNSSLNLLKEYTEMF